MIITDLAVFAFPGGKLALIDFMPGLTMEEIRKRVAAEFAERVEVQV